MKYNNTRQFKENSPKLTAKERIEHLRNQFFKNSDVDSYKRNFNNRDSLKQKRNYSALEFKKDNDAPAKEVYPEKEHIDLEATPNKKDSKIKKAFDFRVQNIDKMNDKIMDLLKYVKQKPSHSKSANKVHPIEEMRARQLKKIRQNYCEKSNNLSLDPPSKRTEIYDVQNHTDQNYKKIVQLDQSYSDIKGFEEYTKEYTKNQRQMDYKMKTQDILTKNKYLYSGKKEQAKAIESRDKSTSSLTATMRQKQKWRISNYQEYEKQVQQAAKNQHYENTQQKGTIVRKKQQGTRNRNYNYCFQNKSTNSQDDSLNMDNKQQFNEVSINNEINKVLARIEQSQAKRKQMFVKYSQNKEKVKQQAKKPASIIPKHIGLSKATVKSYYVDSDKQSSSTDRNQTNFKIQLYQCENSQRHK